MPAANPLVNSPALGTERPGVAAAAEPPSSPGDSLYATAGRSNGRFSVGIGGQGTNVHVAFLILASLGVIVFLHVGGFRFAVDAGVTSR